MVKTVKITFLLMLAVLLNSGALAAQNAAESSPLKLKTVRWEAMSGKDKEFIFYIPENYVTSADGGYYKGGRAGEGAHVVRELKVARYINGVVLMMEYYEGDAKKLQKFLEEQEKSKLTKTEEVNGFQIKTFSDTKNKQFLKTQHFQVKNRLYAVKSVSFSGGDEIVKAFFDSVRLVNKEIAVAPNAAKDVKSTTLPNLIEHEAQIIDDVSAIDEKDADRGIIILKSERPKFPFDAVRSLKSGRMKLRILYSSAGKIGSVEVLESPSKQVEKAAIEAAKTMVFIPAEKDGKLVSVYKTQEYSFETTVEIRRF